MFYHVITLSNHDANTEGEQPAGTTGKAGLLRLFFWFAGRSVQFSRHPKGTLRGDMADYYIMVRCDYPHWLTVALDVFVERAVAQCRDRSALVAVAVVEFMHSRSDMHSDVGCHEGVALRSTSSLHRCRYRCNRACAPLPCYRSKNVGMFRASVEMHVVQTVAFRLAPLPTLIPPERTRASTDQAL
jgi:hypothetical protein